MKVEFEVPIKTISEANCSEHWTKKAKRRKQQHFFVRHAFQLYAKNVQLPCIVTLTRLSSRMLDDDNLTMAFKGIRDELAECLIPESRKSYLTQKGTCKEIKGRADGDSRITWRYGQEKHSKQGIRVTIEWEDHLGSNFDDVLKEEGILAECEEEAKKRCLI